MRIVDSSEYKLLKEVEHDDGLGKTYTAFDRQHTPLLLHVIPSTMTTFIGEEHIKLRLKSLAQSHSSFLPIRKVYCQQGEVIVEYENHQNLVTLHEYMKGKTFKDTIRILEKIAIQLEVLHHESVIQGAIVPSYVWITEGNEVRFMPLYTQSPYELLHGMQRPHYPYFAPELYHLNKFDMRTDIYNLGILFYEILTGTNPNNMVTKQNNVTIEQMDLPFHLKKLVLQMIHKRPVSRLQWVGQIINELQRIQGKDHQERNSDTCLYGSHYLYSPEFIGRKEELQILSKLNRSIIEGRSQSILISGPTGSGRKRLFFEITEDFSGQIDYYVSRADDTPYSVIEQLVTKIIKISIARPILHPILNHLPGLAEVFPKLKTVYKHQLESQDSPAFSLLQTEQFLVDFFIDFLTISETRIVFGIYSAERMDPFSLSILKRLLSLEEIVLGVIGIGEAHELGELYEEGIDLQPLPLREYAHFLLSIFGKASFLQEKLIERLYHYSNKNLTKTIELVHYLADTKQLYIQHYSWHLVDKNIRALSLPPSDELMINHKIQLLLEEEKRIYQVLSLVQIPIVNHHSFLSMIAKVAGVESSEKVLQAIESIQKQGLLLRLMTNYEFPSLTIREFVESTIDETKKDSIHHELAMQLIDGRHYSMVAYHYSQNGNWRKAALFYLIEARRSFRASLYIKAVEMIEKSVHIYEQYLDGMPPKAMLLLMGYSFERSGQLMKAIEIYKQLHEQFDSIKALIRLGFSCSNTKNYVVFEEVEGKIEQLSLDAGIPVKYRIELKIILSTWSIITKRDFTLVEELTQLQNTASESLRKELGVKNYIRLLYNTHNMLYHQKKPWTERERFILEAQSLAEQHDQKFLLSGIYNIIAIGLMDEDLLRAKDFYFKAVEMAKLLGDKQNEKVAKENLFVCYKLLGDIPNSFEFAEKVRVLGNKINQPNDTGFLSEYINHYLFIEDFQNAQIMINKVKREAKKNKQISIRNQVFIFQFKLYVQRNDVHKVFKMWPAVRRVCETNNMVEELRELEFMYLLFTKDFGELIHKVSIQLESSLLTLQERIECMIYKITALQETANYEEALELTRALEQLIYKTKYYGYLGHVCLLRGMFYKKQEQYIQAKVNLTRAKNNFIKLTNDVKVQFVNQQLVELHDKLVTNIMAEHQHVTNLLVNYEVLFDSVKRINASLSLEQLSKNIAIVLYENFLIDRIHLYTTRKNGRKLLSINEKIQLVEAKNMEDVLARIDRTRTYSSFQVDNSTYVCFPVFSDKDEAITFLLVENYTIQSYFSKEERSLIGNLLELVTPKIEKVLATEQVTTDDLTGLFKRDFFLEKLGSEFKKAKAYGTHLSFIMLDLDDFSEVNNVFGHIEGDRVLKEVSSQLRQSVRNGDIVGRYGGEEFIVILPNTNGESATSVAHDLLRVIHRIDIGKGKQLTASIGVSSVDKDEPETMKDLISKADFAEIFAKKNGKNRVVCYWDLVPERL
ncbi:diguanylate cyclase [Bacillus salitolerans]|uniref:Diguanylate cyclase n=1 Tax=Bacillus salitolerans TaxID=1437434 RepID=A0ABW4LPY1_9BACI